MLEIWRVQTDTFRLNSVIRETSIVQGYVV